MLLLERIGISRLIPFLALSILSRDETFQIRLCSRLDVVVERGDPSDKWDEALSKDSPSLILDFLINKSKMEISKLAKVHSMQT